MQSHDKLFRSLMAEEGVVDALLRERLPPELVRSFAGKAERLPEHFVDATLKEHIADQVVRVPLKGGKSAFVYCLLEHKRTPDALVLVQILRYLSLLYVSLAKSKPRALLPPVVPLLVYNGRKRWPGPTRFSELVAAPRAIRHLLLDFGVVLIDVGTEPVAKLSGNATLRGGLMAMKAATVPIGKEGALIRAALKNAKVDLSTWTTLFRYLEAVSKEDGRRVLQRIKSQFRRDDMPTLEQILKDMGRRNGIRVGERRGVKKGREEGRKEGRVEGRVEGADQLANQIRRQVSDLLKARFGELPPAAQHRIDGADPASLLAWLAAARTARSLARLLGIGTRRPKSPRSAARA